MQTFSSDDCQPSIHASLPAPSLTPTPAAATVGSSTISIPESQPVGTVMMDEECDDDGDRKLIRKSLSWPNLHQRVATGHESPPLVTLQLPQEKLLTTCQLPHKQFGDSQRGIWIQSTTHNLLTWDCRTPITHTFI